MPDGGMPERGTVVGSQCYNAADGIASEGYTRIRRKNSRSRPFTSKIVVPANFSGLVIDRSYYRLSEDSVICAGPANGTVLRLRKINALAVPRPNHQQA